MSMRVGLWRKRDWCASERKPPNRPHRDEEQRAQKAVFYREVSSAHTRATGIEGAPETAPPRHCLRPRRAIRGEVRRAMQIAESMRASRSRGMRSFGRLPRSRDDGHADLAFLNRPFLTARETVALGAVRGAFFFAFFLNAEPTSRTTDFSFFFFGARLGDFLAGFFLTLWVAFKMASVRRVAAPRLGFFASPRIRLSEMRLPSTVRWCNESAARADASSSKSISYAVDLPVAPSTAATRVTLPPTELNKVRTSTDDTVSGTFFATIRVNAAAGSPTRSRIDPRFCRTTSSRSLFWIAAAT
eukprot:CAMPEP_0197393856 /NCGR_PEP_ID=MMETSP1165-20131217/4555_1 /TAXON_ID=284809 /ORGANISM="Chrysocystis fragilis, Strain CCMP3189" /LENGTH=300 /DNA_ID=CAMNT_0042919533 /DNA_START=246 /DNA_END=1144 /DNA_ORIENTATION=-